MNTSTDDANKPRCDFRMIVSVTKDWNAYATPLKVLRKQMIHATDEHERVNKYCCQQPLKFWINRNEINTYICTNLYTGCGYIYPLNMKPIREPIRIAGQSIPFMSTFEELSYLICPRCK